MDSTVVESFTAFDGVRRIASGALAEVALAAKSVFEKGEQGTVLIFRDSTGEQVDLDLRGSDREIQQRFGSPVAEGETGPSAVVEVKETPKGPGRPKLGVVAREVTLLPRHWDWLNNQPGGASVALRKLVEEARRANEGRDRARRSQEATFRFMSTMAGNLPDFEEASRALFAQDSARFQSLIASWPEDIRDHLVYLAQGSMAVGS